MTWMPGSCLPKRRVVVDISRMQGGKRVFDVGVALCGICLEAKQMVHWINRRP